MERVEQAAGPVDMPASGTPSIALVHDYLTQRGGAERVVLAMCRTFPDAPLVTSLYDPAGTYPDFAGRVTRTSWLDRSTRLRANHRLALPLLAPAFSSLRVDADVVLCSSSGWAHGVRTDGHQVVYCHAPARWLYQREAYLAGRGRGTRVVLAGLAPPLRRWDRRAASGADRYLVNSTHTRRMVADAYGIDAEVLHPPHGVDATGPQDAVADLEPGFWLLVSRLMPYKNVDVVLAALATRPTERLVVVGTGPLLASLQAEAPANVVFLPEVTDAELRWLYASARGLVAASYEDFGLTPIEAAAFGTPTVALRFGGYLDTVVEGETGVFFESPSPTAVSAGLDDLVTGRWPVEAIRTHSDRFSEARFAARLREVVSG